MDEWKAQAEALFFIEHLNITNIAEIVRKTRKTVSGHINGCDGYEAEMAFRKRASAVKRREYQRNWDRENRTVMDTDVCAESLRREHDIAALVLSREGRYG